MGRPPKPTYKTTNWHAYNQALRQRGSLTVRFAPLMLVGGSAVRAAWPPESLQRRCDLGPPDHQGSLRPAALPDRAMLRHRFEQPWRGGFVASLLEFSALGWAVPDFSTLSRRQKTLEVVIPFRGSKGSLHLLVDSSGWRAKESGTRTSMAARNEGLAMVLGPVADMARGARSISGSTRKRSRSGRWKSRQAMSAISSR
ncbi:Transposase DDE domain-containing protein [Paracoccus alcaliphilus]|uniref:Transposase DDE domain-containing protein n=1 Tax=Paracoccus alcaliphilus TaxID=34002 RepID=A0A1H8JV33_9RHOB|nr:Transposase DDE domain-containing protein [Paracoccus alcaliphilus]